jgi:O-antigen ligase
LSTAEASSTERQTILLLAAVGVTLLAAERIRDRERLDDLLRRVVLGATFMAFVGIIQYTTGRDLSEILVPPGLTPTSSAASAIAERSSLRRVAGTASHPIEFGVVLAMVLPLALHFAMIARERLGRITAWGQVIVIGLALPLSISRSAVLSLLVGIMTAMTVWSARSRLNFLFAFLAFLPVFKVAAPGVLGTLRALFLWAGEDPSVSGRTDDYSIVWQLVAERPILGRGLGTFIPGQYIFLDNQFLGLLIEIGAIGLTTVIVWVLVAVSCARGVRRRAAEATDRALGQAIVAGIFAAVASFATFDALGFAIITYTLFLLAGCAGALWRMTAADLERSGRTT